MPYRSELFRFSFVAASDVSGTAKKKTRRWLQKRFEARLSLKTASSATRTIVLTWLGDRCTGIRSQSPINRRSCYFFVFACFACAPTTHNEHIFCQKEVTGIDVGNCLWKKRKLIEEDGTKRSSEERWKPELEFDRTRFDVQEFVDKLKMVDDFPSPINPSPVDRDWRPVLAIDLQVHIVSVDLQAFGSLKHLWFINCTFELINCMILVFSEQSKPEMID